MSQTVCQYWLQGNCRFGNTCWNRHEAVSAPVQRSAPGATAAAAGGKKQAADWRLMSDEEILKGIAVEIHTWETSKMWPLSVFSFANGAPILPGLNNVSFEEVRWEAYQAKAQGTFDQHVQKLAQTLQEARQQKQILQNPDPAFRQKLLEFINQAKGPQAAKPGIFGGGTFQTQSNAPSAFQQQAANPFGGQQPAANAFQNAMASSSSMFAPSIFGQQTQQPQQQAQPTPGLFSQPPAQPTPGLFSQPAAQPPPGLFGQQPTVAAPQPAQIASPFQFNPPAPAQPSNNIFGNPQTTPQPSAPAPQGLFGQQAATPAPVSTNPFPTPQAAPKTLFGKAVETAPVQATVSAPEETAGIYSKLEELSQAELDAFRADDFASLESIPLRPPPRELCF